MPVYAENHVPHNTDPARAVRERSTTMPLERPLAPMRHFQIVRAPSVEHRPPRVRRFAALPFPLQDGMRLRREGRFPYAAAETANSTCERLKACVLHSCRSAMTGSMREARRAGINAASDAEANRIETAMAMVRGSRG